MARLPERAEKGRERSRAALRIRDLQVYYGESHAIQGVELTLESGILAIVGRNGMGKTTLCNTIVGLKKARSGSITVQGREIAALEPHQIARLGVGYVPQGRRVWRSLSVDDQSPGDGQQRNDAAKHQPVLVSRQRQSEKEACPKRPPLQ